MTDGAGTPDGWLDAYAGLDLGAALRLAQTEGRVARVLGPHDVVTLEWMPARLNLHVDDDQTLLRVSAG